MRDLGAKDIIIDPGFGFGKTVEHNYMLMDKLEEFRIFRPSYLSGNIKKINDIQVSRQYSGRCTERNNRTQHHFADERGQHTEGA